MGDQEEEKEVTAGRDSGVDGWLETSATPAPLPMPMPMPREVEDGKTLAVLCHASLLFGLPIFLVPMMTRDNRFALHHAKAASMTYALFLGSAALTTVTCGLFFPAMLLCYVPAFVGIVRAANGKVGGTWGMGDLGERVLGGLIVAPEKLPSSPKHRLDDF